ncbi:hypothetical protein EMIT036CA2_11240 [Chryseobacterium sp. IT-36CA2]
MRFKESRFTVTIHYYNQNDPASRFPFPTFTNNESEIFNSNL